MAFALYFLGEYGNMLLMSALITLLFCGGWLPIFNFINVFPIFFSLKIIFFSFSYVLVRATFPRYRYDQLMDIGWKIFLPLTIALLFFITSILLTFNLSTNLFF
jgi:NADH-quinone oxidoreductase subunit H